MNQKPTTDFRRNESFNPQPLEQQRLEQDFKDYHPIISKGNRNLIDEIKSRESASDCDRKGSASFMNELL